MPISSKATTTMRLSRAERTVTGERRGGSVLPLSTGEEPVGVVVLPSAPMTPATMTTVGQRA